MSDRIHSSVTLELDRKSRDISVDTAVAFQVFNQRVFADEALTAKIKQIIAVAVAHVTRCPYCTEEHTKVALQHGASKEELMEAILVAAEVRAGAAYVHAVLAIDEMEKVAATTS